MDCKNLEIGDVVVFNENARSLAFYYIEKFNTSSLEGKVGVVVDKVWHMDDYIIRFYLLIDGKPFYNLWGEHELFMFWLDMECERDSFKVVAKTKDTHAKISQHD